MIRFLAVVLYFIGTSLVPAWADNGAQMRNYGTDITVLWRPATAFDDRPPGIAIDTIVLHATERRFLWQVIEYFERPTAKASAHFTIDKTGTVVQHVEIEKRAWHAGASRMNDGRESVNDFSIGIELVNLNDGKDPYPEPQLIMLRRLIGTLKERYPIKTVTTHFEIAIPPGRKSDPVGFDLSWIDR